MFTADSCCSRLRRLRKVTLLTLVGQPPLGVVGSTRSEEDTGRQGQVISGGVGISRRISVSLKALRWVPKACEQWVWCMNAESLICDCCCNVISGHGSFDVVSVNLIYLLSVEARWRHMAYHNTKYWGYWIKLEQVVLDQFSVISLVQMFELHLLRTSELYHWCFHDQGHWVAMLQYTTSQEVAGPSIKPYMDWRRLRQTDFSLALEVQSRIISERSHPN
jgi:hypothetical protein